MEYRRLRSSSRLREYLSWPGVEQVCVLERVRRTKGAERREVAFAITSLTPERAPASVLLGLARGHWGIENRLHWVKDVVLGEDACRVRSGRGPEILAGLRNAALRLLRKNNMNAIASALRHLAAFPRKAVQLVTQGRITDL